MHVSVPFEVNLWSSVNYCVNKAEHHNITLWWNNTFSVNSSVAIEFEKPSNATPKCDLNIIILVK